MNKDIIKQKLLADYQEQIDKLSETVKSYRTHANDNDLNSEGKYDTRATEAKYLADGMAKKLEDLKLDLQMLEQLPTNTIGPKEEIAIGSLVKLEHNGKLNWYYLGPVAGGKMLNIDGEVILVISVFSPLGPELIGSYQGEEIVVETPKGEKAYIIKEAY